MLARRILVKELDSLASKNDYTSRGLDGSLNGKVLERLFIDHLIKNRVAFFVHELPLAIKFQRWSDKLQGKKRLRGFLPGPETRTQQIRELIEACLDDGFIKRGDELLYVARGQVNKDHVMWVSSKGKKFLNILYLPEFLFEEHRVLAGIVIAVITSPFWLRLPDLFIQATSLIHTSLEYLASLFFR